MVGGNILDKHRHIGKSCFPTSFNASAACPLAAWTSAILVVNPRLFNPVCCEEVIRLCCLFQIVDFRPLFIAPALRRFDTVFNVNEQRHAPICLRDFCSAGMLALYPFLDCVLGVVCADSPLSG